MTNELQQESARLRVAKARPQDAGRAVARVDPDIARGLGLQTGDIISIRNPVDEQDTVATVYPGYPDDAGSQTIRIDGVVRRNAAVGIDDKVDIRVVEPRAAERINIAPVNDPVGPFDVARLVTEHLVGRPAKIGDLVRIEVMGQAVDMVVTDHRPHADAVLISAATDVCVSEEPAAANAPQVTYEDIGGLGDEVRRVRELIELPLRHPEVFTRVGVDPPKGVLLHGPPGTGKTLLAKAVANETGAAFFHIGGPEVMSKFHGQSEENLREIFEDARKQAPSIIFIDEIDSIAPNRDATPGETERRLVAQLLSLMDGLQERGRVVVIAATNRPDSLDPALRRPGRFDREIEIGVPDEAGRLQILQVHTRAMPLADGVEMEPWAKRTHGYVGADLAHLAREAGMAAVRRTMPELDLEAAEISQQAMGGLHVTSEDLETAFRGIVPSAMREVAVEIPDVTWSDVGGLEGARQELVEAIEWPLRYRALYDRAGAEVPRGVLLHGPPGTGKTLLAKALAHEAAVNFISIKGPELLSKWVGESEQGVRQVFARARQNAPCIVFFDEIDALVPRRGTSADSHVSERVVGQFLTELDGLESLRGVLVVAATNRPELLDDALLRPGRFDRIVEVPLPDREARAAILEVHAAKLPLRPEVDVAGFAAKTEGWSGAELAAICHEASLLAIRRAITGGIDATDDAALSQFSIGPEDFLEAYEKVGGRRPEP